MTQARFAVAYAVIGSAMLATACGASATPQELVGPAAVATQIRAAPAETQVADPARVRIPAIGVDAAVLPLVVDGQGVLPRRRRTWTPGGGGPARNRARQAPR